MYINIRYIYISLVFLFQTSNQNNGGGEAPYIGKTKLLRQATKGQRGLRGGQGLLEKLGQWVSFLGKPRQGGKASSRSFDQRVQENGSKGVQRVQNSHTRAWGAGSVHSSCLSGHPFILLNTPEGHLLANLVGRLL